MATKKSADTPKEYGPDIRGSLKVCLCDGPRRFKSGYISIYYTGRECPDPAEWPKLLDHCGRVMNNDGRLTDGCCVFCDLPLGHYLVVLEHEVADPVRCVEVRGHCISDVCFDVGLDARASLAVLDADCTRLPCAPFHPGAKIEALIEGKFDRAGVTYTQPPHWTKTDALTAVGSAGEPGPHTDMGSLGIHSTEPGREDAMMDLPHTYRGEGQRPVPVSGKITVNHQRHVAEPDGRMSELVRHLDTSRAMSFGEYRKFIDTVFRCDDSDELAANEAMLDKNRCYDRLTGGGSKFRRLERELADHGVGAYELLKTATEIFLLIKCCTHPCEPEGGAWPIDYDYNPILSDHNHVPSEKWRSLLCKQFENRLGNQRLPYIQRVIDTAFGGYDVAKNPADRRFCENVLLSRVDHPCFMELIWNYWHEEGMLVQSINAVSRRFQNQRAPGERDPLAHVEIDPLRPLNNILWGYVEDERDRLSIKRRAYEYQHQYGLNLYGKAVSMLRPADNRSKFIEAFHNLLNKAADYYRAKQDTTVDPDGYPLLHALQELNLILAQGAHNQFGDLAWTARVEMLMQEWIMARREMRDFLQSRAMVPYKEEWMPQVDTMKTMQGWSDVAVTHFRDLGVFGEQILLTVRWYDWYDVTIESEAKAWADLMRAQVQGYIHGYRAVAGVDLSAMDAVDYTMPSVHLRKRLAMQQRVR